MDVSAEKMIFGVTSIDPQRRAELIKVLDIDLSWRLHKVSDGQRRRIQICMGLLKPFKVFQFSRWWYCNFNASISMLPLKVYVAHGKLQLAMPMDKVKEISNLSLMRTVERWLRKERDEERNKRKERKAYGLPEFENQNKGSHVMGSSTSCCYSCIEQ